MANLNIVVYGCDNSGKTTLCNHITQWLNNKGIKAKYIKSLGPATMSKQVDFIYNHLNSDEAKVKVFDRFPIIEEEVCGLTLRNKNNFSSLAPFVITTLNEITLFIHCDPGKEAIQNWGTREQMEGIKENSSDLMEGYSAYSTIHGIQGRTIKYNYQKDSWEKIATIITMLFETMED